MEIPLNNAPTQPNLKLADQVVTETSRLMQETEIQHLDVRIPAVVYGKVFSGTGSASDFTELNASSELQGSMSSPQRSTGWVRQLIQVGSNPDLNDLMDFWKPQSDYKFNKYKPEGAVMCLGTMDGSVLINELYKLTEADRQRVHEEEVKQARFFVQMDVSVLPRNDFRIASRHGSAIIPALWNGGPHPLWKRPDQRSSPKSVRLFNTEYLRSAPQDPAFVGTLPIWGENIKSITPSRDGRKMQFWEDAGMFSDQGRLVYARVFSLLKQDKKIDFISEYPDGRNMGLLSRINFGSAISYIASADPNPGSRFINWATDPISDGLLDLNMHRRHEPIYHERIYSAKVDPGNLGQITQNEKDFANFLKVFAEKDFATAHGVLMRGNMGQKFFN